ncbi:MAG: T9SS type A sorting domain-containing protein [Bacteroidales bacterium]|nr:T9SS type A sorting domain-containing protein [Bacteroidales bacterium]
MRFLVLIAVFLISSFSMAQQETYTHIYSGPSYDEGIAAFRLPNKEIRLIGNTGSFGSGNTDVWLIALDSNGGFLWHKFYGGTKIEKAEDAVMNSKGDLFIVGSTTQNSLASYQVYFLGLDQYGQIIGYNNYGGHDWDLGKGICLINDTTFALVGETYSAGAGQSDLYLLTVNQFGDTLWTKNYGGSMSDRGNSIELLPDGGFVIAGATESYGNGSFDSYMLRTNSQGDTIWTKVVEHITDAEFLDVVVNPDTTLVFSGYRKDTLDTYRDINLEKYDQNANFIWSRFNALSEGKDCYAKSLIREPNGLFTFCGITTEFAHSQFSDARIVRTTPSGWWEESNSLGDMKQDMGNSVLLDDFHGKHYFLIGTTKSYDVSMSALYFVRLDSNFNTDTTRNVFTPTAIEVSRLKESIKVYPNPVDDILYVEIPKNERVIAFQVYDMKGREIPSLERNKVDSKFVISTQNLRKGVYLLTLRTQKSTYIIRFIKT